MKAKFSNYIKKQILDRDIVCIICWKQWTDIHHIFFSQEAEYSDDRNNIDKGNLLCRDCHNKAHSCKRWEWVRQQCINYITKKYGK